jgi:hypothetical protein
MAGVDDCRNCRFNTYAEIDGCKFVSCGHPVTIAKMPQWQPGDPAFVSYRTSDVAVTDLNNLDDCPAWEPRTPQDTTEPSNG